MRHFQTFLFAGLYHESICAFFTCWGFFCEKHTDMFSTKELALHTKSEALNAKYKMYMKKGSGFPPQKPLPPMFLLTQTECKQSYCKAVDFPKPPFNGGWGKLQACITPVGHNHLRWHQAFRWGDAVGFSRGIHEKGAFIAPVVKTQGSFWEKLEKRITKIPFKAHNQLQRSVLSISRLMQF